MGGLEDIIRSSAPGGDIGKRGGTVATKAVAVFSEEGGLLDKLQKEELGNVVNSWVVLVGIQRRSQRGCTRS